MINKMDGTETKIKHLLCLIAELKKSELHETEIEMIR